MQKMYCFVDESGQDTLGKFFVVAILTIKDKKDELGDLITEYEAKSGKNNVKWSKTTHAKRMDFISRLFSDKNIKGSLFYSLYKSVDYDYFMILSIAKVVNKTEIKKGQRISVYVDGLTKTKVKMYSNELRKLGIKNCKVKGVKKDENNVFIRIVDSVAGFIRLALYKKEIDCKKIFNGVTRSKILVEI